MNGIRARLRNLSKGGDHRHRHHGRPPTNLLQPGPPPSPPSSGGCGTAHGYLVLPSFFERERLGPVNRVVDAAWAGRADLGEKIVIDIFTETPEERRIYLRDAPDEARLRPYKLNGGYLQYDEIRNLVLDPNCAWPWASCSTAAPSCANSLNLFHGGSAIDDTSITRRSIVTHYFRAMDMDQASVAEVGPGRYYLRRDPQKAPAEPGARPAFGCPCPPSCRGPGSPSGPATGRQLALRVPPGGGWDVERTELGTVVVTGRRRAWVRRSPVPWPLPAGRPSGERDAKREGRWPSLFFSVRGVV